VIRENGNIPALVSGIDLAQTTLAESIGGRSADATSRYAPVVDDFRCRMCEESTGVATTHSRDDRTKSAGDF
jgi:hypothetical protein